ncbi:MAG: glycosyltransferase family 4 protein [Candidatus Acidiferrum sp.]
MSRAQNNRILMFLENVPFPQDIRVRREANALTAAGYRVTVICPSGNDQPFRETVNGVRVLRYPTPPPANGFLGYLWEYGYSMLATFVLSVLVFFADGFDAVHAHNPPDTFVFIALVYKLFGKRFIYDHHDLSPEMYQARFSGSANSTVYRVLLRLEKLSCRFADHVIVTNESYKRLTIERGKVPESRISIVRNGIELNLLDQPIEPHRALRELGKTIIGYVGVMGFQDGVDYLLRALDHLVHDCGRTDFYCVIIGGGDAWSDLQAQAHRLNLDSCVLFTGFLYGDELRRYLSAAEICVDPTPSNPYSDQSTMFKIMEYMSLGKPVVAFNLPEHRFTAQHSAIYVTPNDTRAFANAIAELMDNPRRREALGLAGRNRIESQLAWDYSVPNLLHAYSLVLPAAVPTKPPVPQIATNAGKSQASPFAPNRNGSVSWR